jgi:hypothetical protein
MVSVWRSIAKGILADQPRRHALAHVGGLGPRRRREPVMPSSVVTTYSVVLRPGPEWYRAPRPA